MLQEHQPDPMANLAIVEPEIPHESQQDVFRSHFERDYDLQSVVERYGRLGMDAALQLHRRFCLAIADAAAKECGKRGVEDGYSHSTLEAVAELLKLFTEPSYRYDGRLLAHVLLLVINRNTLSEVEIAKLCNVTRACVSKLKVELQDRYHLHPRCGRCEQARKKFSKLVRARGPRRKENQWRAKNRFEEILRNGSKTSGKSSKKTATKRLRQRRTRRTRP